MSYVVNCSIYGVAKNELRSKLRERLSKDLYFFGHLAPTRLSHTYLQFLKSDKHIVVYAVRTLRNVGIRPK